MKSGKLWMLLLCCLLLAVAGCDAEVEGDAAGECSDGVDNDQDGPIDCDDPGCATATACIGDDDDTGDDDTSDDDDDDDTTSGDDDTGSDDDDSADALVWTTLNCTGVTLSDGDGDGIWSPGEVLSIQADLVNEGPVDHMMYPTFQLEASGADVDLGLTPEWYFFGMMVNSPLQGQWSVTAPPDCPTPLEVEFTITGQNMNPENPCGGGFEPPCVNSTPFVFSATIE